MPVSDAWKAWRRSVGDLESYDARWARMAAEGKQVHGEVDVLCSYAPSSVLDVGCGTGRVAIELARRGIETVGVDLDQDLLALSRHKAPHLRWVHGDATEIDLGERFDVVVMAGNVPNFCRPERRHLLPERAAAHLTEGGRLVAGFALDAAGPAFDDWTSWCEAAGLRLEERWGGWDREPPREQYAVGVWGAT